MRPTALPVTVACAITLAGCHRAESPVAPPAADPPLLLAVAADLSPAMEALAADWAAQGHPRPTFTTGASGVLATQITQGAPFDVFAAANTAYVRDVVRAGRCDPATVAPYARGQLVVYIPPNGPPVRTLTDLASPRVTAISLAQPDHAPYGHAAREALTAAGLWDTVAPRVVYGENVQQALQFVRSGNASVAFVSRSLAGTLPGSYTLVPPGLYTPMDQSAVVCAHGANGSQARAFVRYLTGPAGLRILQHNGFLPPGAPTPGH